MYLEASSKVCHGSFCQLGSSVSLSWVIYYGAFYLYDYNSITINKKFEAILTATGVS
jgi:hypothetical protein